MVCGVVSEGVVLAEVVVRRWIRHIVVQVMRPAKLRREQRERDERGAPQMSHHVMRNCCSQSTHIG